MSQDLWDQQLNNLRFSSPARQLIPLAQQEALTQVKEKIYQMRAMVKTGLMALLILMFAMGGVLQLILLCQMQYWMSFVHQRCMISKILQIVWLATSAQARIFSLRLLQQAWQTHKLSCSRTFQTAQGVHLHAIWIFRRASISRITHGSKLLYECEHIPRYDISSMR